MLLVARGRLVIRFLGGLFGLVIGVFRLAVMRIGRFCGVSDSMFRNNLVFSNSKQAVVIYDYDSTSQAIVAYDQTGNTFVNNTLWVGRYSVSGYSPSPFAAVLFNDATAASHSFDDNIFRNNIIVSDSGEAFEFYQADFADTQIIENNLIYSIGDGRPMGYAGTTYGAAQFEGFSSLIRNNVFANPRFADVSVDYYDRPELFNFNLLSSSPAINLGVNVDAPATDITGLYRIGLPDAGCYEATS